MRPPRLGRGLAVTAGGRGTYRDPVTGLHPLIINPPRGLPVGAARGSERAGVVHRGR